jgi:hypothetical protein
MNIDAKALEIAKTPGLLIDCFPTDPSEIDYEMLSSLIAAALLAVRNEALEEAAKVADKMGGDFIEQDLEGMAYCEAKRDIATAIRALKTTTG